MPSRSVLISNPAHDDNQQRFIQIYRDIYIYRIQGIGDRDTEIERKGDFYIYIYLYRIFKWSVRLSQLRRAFEMSSYLKDNPNAITSMK